MEIGSKGLQEVNLTIPQSTSLDFTVVHEDESGHVVDHSLSQVYMKFQTEDKKETIDISSFVTPTASAIYVAIPATFTEGLSLGRMLWDLIAVTTSGSSVRLCYGSVLIVDTYSLDGE